MSARERTKLADRQMTLNRATEGSASLFAPHRRRIMDLALGAEDGPAAVLGAGNCNDVDLPALASRYGEVHLVDLDGEALGRAIARQPDETRTRLVGHGGRELSGLGDLLAGWEGRDPSPEEIDAAIAAAGGAALPVGELGLCLSSCLLTQMILAIVDRLGAQHARCVDVVRALRTGHLRAMARSLRPGSLAVLVSDMVSSDTAPGLAQVAPSSRRGLMKALVQARNFFTGANPFVITASLEAEPEVRDVELCDPWLWQIGPQRSYLVFAVRFRRAGG